MASFSQTRRALLLGAPALLAARAGRSQQPGLDDAFGRAAALEPMRAMIVARNGETLREERFRGPSLERPVNVKSVSKAVIAAMAGIAIGRGVLEGVEQPVAPLLRDRLPPDPDPRLARVTIGDLLSMRAGLERTSGSFYGGWVNSPDWVRAALARPFVAEPGGPMLYSTGNTHLLSAILTRVAGRSTLALARDWLGAPLGIEIPPWSRDPQGIYFGGNDMLLSPRALLRFGELHRLGGTWNGRRVLPEGWVGACWEPRTASVFTGDAYGYGWFARGTGTALRHYAWGYGGQMVHVLPALGATVVMTSDAAAPQDVSRRHSRALHALLEETLIPALGAS